MCNFTTTARLRIVKLHFCVVMLDKYGLCINLVLTVTCVCGRADSGVRMVPGVAPAGGDTLVPRRLDAGVTADSDVIAASVPGDESGMVVVPVVVNRLVLGMTFDLLCNKT